MDSVINDAESGSVEVTLSGVDSDINVVSVTLSQPGSDDVIASPKESDGVVVPGVFVASATSFADGDVTVTANVEDFSGNVATGSDVFDLDTSAESEEPAFSVYMNTRGGGEGSALLAEAQESYEQALTAKGQAEILSADADALLIQRTNEASQAATDAENAENARDAQQTVAADAMPRQSLTLSRYVLRQRARCRTQKTHSSSSRTR